MSRVWFLKDMLFEFVRIALPFLFFKKEVFVVTTIVL